MNTKIDNIGVLIRSERTRRGMTQEELGERVGVGKAQISKIESGRWIDDPYCYKSAGHIGPVGIGALADHGSRRSAHNWLYCGQHK